ncbi:hypothetical protein Y032_0004g1765 [Ancylostoma ceylanicum]|uniref:SCP domain-containing protein n=2 Tax=Ancylostoma ceylanicum TaxID=53326 RepID=A0A016VTX5_9BILA|nr:hypothetical protein Y032_0004g1765 [Ancylostoma ceylanicum]
MAKLYFIALAIVCLLPALCEGNPVVFATPQCQGGYLDQSTINTGVLNPINTARENVAKGNQQNGPNGTNLPSAKSMTQMSWSCELEQTAVKALENGKCLETAPDSGGKASFFDNQYDYPATPISEILANAFNDNYLSQIKNNKLNVQSQGTVTSTVTFNGPDNLKSYANLIRPEAKEIGCAFNRCTSPEVKYTYYCILNTEDIKTGETVYQGDPTQITSCSQVTCPSGYMCNTTTLLCEATTVATATSAPSTSSSLVTSPSSSPSTPSATTTRATTTTTIPTSSQAQFPSGGGGGMCSTSHNYAGRMTDAIRNEYVRLHNFRRGLLATGQIPRKDGKYLPKASNMWSMSYDCALEAGAIKHASTCPSALSDPNSRPNEGENFKSFPATKFDFGTAAKKSVTEWWKPIRSVNYFEKVVVFRPFHVGAPISSFTQMGWASSNKLGCSIVRCTTENRYVGVCRYRAGGNIVNSNVYQVGNPCSMNPGGATRCNPSEGLWS